MKKHHLIAILLLALGARMALYLAAFQNPEGFCLHDTPAYMDFSDDLLYRASFGQPPQIFRTPGYPLVLALCAATTRESKDLLEERGVYNSQVAQWPLAFYEVNGKTWVRAVGIQVAFDVALVGLTCILGARLVGPRVGTVAGLLQALSPLAVASGCRVLSDSLYAFAFTVALLFMVAYVRGGRWRLLVASGFALGAATYVRPVGIAMAPIFALAVLCRPGQPLRGLRLALGRAVHLILFTLVYVACLTPWVIRNSLRADYRGFSSAYADTLFVFACPRILETDPTYEEALKQIDPLIYERTSVRDYGPLAGELEAYWERFASEHHRYATRGEMARWRRGRVVEIIGSHPWTYLKLHAKGSLAFWLPATDALEIAGLTEGGRGTLGVLRERGLWAGVRNYFGDNWNAPVWHAALLAVPIALFTLVQYAGAILCAARGIRRTRFRLPAEVWLLALVVLVSAAMPGVVAHPRFRVPVEPILNVAAAAGLVAVFRKKKAQD